MSVSKYKHEKGASHVENLKTKIKPTKNLFLTTALSILNVTDKNAPPQKSFVSLSSEQLL